MDEYIMFHRHEFEDWFKNWIHGYAFDKLPKEVKPSAVIFGEHVHTLTKDEARAENSRIDL